MRVLERRGHPPRIAAIDLGSNSVHLVVAEANRNGVFRVLANEKIVLRLAREIDEHGFLSEKVIADTIHAFRQFREIATAYTRQIRAVATFAMREAKNHAELTKRVWADSRVAIEIVDGREEARLEFLGVEQGLPIFGKQTLLVDIGGGSTEIMLAKSRAVAAGNPQAQFDFADSLRLGAVTLTKKFLDQQHPSSKDFERLEHHIDEILASVDWQTRKLNFEVAVASSGTAKAIATTCARLVDGDELSDPNGYVYSVGQLRDLYKRFRELGSPKKIRQEFSIDLRRAEILTAGTAVLLAISKKLGVKEWMASTYSLREGLVVDTLQKQGFSPTRDSDRIRWHHASAFAEQMGIDVNFAQKVKILALELYDGLMRHGFKLREDSLHHERELLEIASYLSEVGRAIGYQRFHKHSAYVLNNSGMMGFTQVEKKILALVVRYHRRALPSVAEKKLDPLLNKLEDRILLLSGCIRLASILNRSRQNKIRHVRVQKIDNNCLKLCFDVNGSLKMAEAELYQAKSEVDILSKCFRYDLAMSAFATK